MVFLSVSAILAVSITLASFIYGAAAEGPRVIRFGTAVNEQDSFQHAAELFAQLVYERTDGAYMIDIFPNAALGDERTMLEGMQMGTLDMAIITGGSFVNFVQEMGVLDMPFLFDSGEQAYYILDGEVGRELLDLLGDVRLKGLAFAERGFRNLTNSVVPVYSAEDLPGLQIRVMENEIYIAAFEALGANAVPMAWTEALTALGQGTIDGQENPINVIYSFRLWETQRYITMTRHAYASAIITMSLGLFDSLPQDVRQIFLDSALDAAIFTREWNAGNEAAQMDALRENGMEIIEYPDIESFRDAVQGVYEGYEDVFGYHISKINRALGRD